LYCKARGQAIKPNLEKALADITTIRSQMARGTEFRGYGPVTVAATGVLALFAAGLQTWLVPAPTDDVFAYLVLWVVTATISVGLIGVEMVARTRRIHSGLADAMIRAATEQFIPAGVAGALVSYVLFHYSPESLWMLPGLWQIFYSLGLFAACRSLPGPMRAAAAWYLVAGLASLAFASEANALSPWAMALPFGIGQFLIAALLYCCAGENNAEG
jgi:hypothetical protein